MEAQGPERWNCRKSNTDLLEVAYQVHYLVFTAQTEPEIYDASCDFECQVIFVSFGAFDGVEGISGLQVPYVRISVRLD